MSQGDWNSFSLAKKLIDSLSPAETAVVTDATDVMNASQVTNTTNTSNTTTTGWFPSAMSLVRENPLTAIGLTTGALLAAGGAYWWANSGNKIKLDPTTAFPETYSFFEGKPEILKVLGNLHPTQDEDVIAALNREEIAEPFSELEADPLAQFAKLPSAAKLAFVNALQRRHQVDVSSTVAPMTEGVFTDTVAAVGAALTSNPMTGGKNLLDLLTPPPSAAAAPAPLKPTSPNNGATSAVHGGVAAILTPSVKKPAVTSVGINAVPSVASAGAISAAAPSAAIASSALSSAILAQIELIANSDQKSIAKARAEDPKFVAKLTPAILAKLNENPAKAASFLSQGMPWMNSFILVPTAQMQKLNSVLIVKFSTPAAAVPPAPAKPKM